MGDLIELLDMSRSVTFRLLNGPHGRELLIHAVDKRGVERALQEVTEDANIARTADILLNAVFMIKRDTIAALHAGPGREDG